MACQRRKIQGRTTKIYRFSYDKSEKRSNSEILIIALRQINQGIISLKYKIKEFYSHVRISHHLSYLTINISLGYKCTDSDYLQICYTRKFEWKISQLSQLNCSLYLMLFLLQGSYKILQMKVSGFSLIFL